LNTIIRKFKQTGHEFLSPILAFVSILYRASALGVPGKVPIGAFRPTPTTSTFAYVTSTDVIRIMHVTCLATYPNPDNCLHKNVDRIVANSLLVTAAVALLNMSYSIDEMAYRLSRWQPQYVQHYLRECSTHANEQTMSTMAGV
jgi:hypothetical protein